MWTIPGWVHVGVTCQSNIHIPHIVTRLLHLLWFSRHCRSVAHDERVLLLHTSAASAVLICMSVSGARRKASWEAYVCSLYMLRAKRAGAAWQRKDLTHTTVQHSSNLLLVLLAARWWTLGVSTRVLGLFWDSCDLSFSYNSCFLFGFVMVLIWNVVSSSPLSPVFSFVPFLLDSALPPSIACVCTTYSSLCPVASRRARC